ncbi:hypothetical protein ACYULU_11120 [Breznakiellaceae bacterium SP9]
MKKLSALVVFLALLSSAAWCDNLKVPSWLLGTWHGIGSADGEKYEETIEFRSNDLINDGESFVEVVETLEGFFFTEKSNANSYAVRLEHIEGNWVEYLYFKPQGKTLKAAYSSAAGDKLTLTFTKIK